MKGNIDIPYIVAMLVCVVLAIIVGTDWNCPPCDCPETIGDRVWWDSVHVGDLLAGKSIEMEITIPISELDCDDKGSYPPPPGIVVPRREDTTSAPVDSMYPSTNIYMDDYP